MGPRLFLQEQQQPAPQQSTPGIDIGGLVDGIVNGFRTILTGWANDLPAQAATNAEPFVRDAWQRFWFSGLNVFGTPLDMTRDFPASQLLGREIRVVLPAIAALAVALLCLRIAWRVVSGAGGQDQFDAASTVLFGFFLASISTTIVGLSFQFTVQATQAIGNINYAPAMMGPEALSNFVFWVLTLLIMMFYGWRLLVRGAYRIVLLMFLAPWAPLAGILVAIPQTRWIAKVYWQNLGGWLAGGVLAVAALSMGLQLATIGNTNPIISLVFSVALMQLAYDLMAWLPSAFSNASANLGASNGMGGFAIPAMAGAAVAGGVATAGVTTVAPAVAGIAGALPAGGEMPGLGY